MAKIDWVKLWFKVIFYGGIIMTILYPLYLRG